jgi:hypothetical protein
VVTEHGGIVQSADNRIDGVHESELALPSTRGDHVKHDVTLPDGSSGGAVMGGDMSFRGREHDMTVLSGTSSPPTGKVEEVRVHRGGERGGGTGRSAVQVEVVGATDLPRSDIYGLANPFVCISLFPAEAGSTRALLAAHDTLEVA